MNESNLNSLNNLSNLKDDDFILESEALRSLKKLGFKDPYKRFEKYYNSPISLTSQFYFCPIPLRLDTYSGCSHQCVYCFANNSDMKFLGSSEFEKTNREFTGVMPTKFANVKEYFDVAFENKENKFREQEALAVECIKHRVPIHWGGMSDPFQPLEAELGISYRVLRLFKKYNYPVVVSSKGILLNDERYFQLITSMPNLALQISLIDDRDEVIKVLEPNAPTATERLAIMKRYSDAGIWVACRIQPLIINLNEDRIIPLLDKLKTSGVKHVMVEGLKFFSGNKNANKRIGEAFKSITGKAFDLEAYYKSIGSKNSGNDLELPTWRKFKYAKIFAEEIRKRNMTYGGADNDLRFLGDSPCCCGIENLKGFENVIKHNTGYAIFNALRSGKAIITYEDIKSFWFPKGNFRIVMGKEEIAKKLGKKVEDVTREDTNIPIENLFDNAWFNGNKNSPCDVCAMKYLGEGNYTFKSKDELEAELKDRGSQKTLL